ncbi:CLUMA_CG009656, isoform A [Clunio marinus]|uniref:CLUMA_CG009656, isoform A n=1 Tax=Clunio marinus TaxID=568069 RepID=A0A1J1I7G8_9DIPT|nr:CLUMA_CG009656, isoform A [Clunio marinus]
MSTFTSFNAIMIPENVDKITIRKVCLVLVSGWINGLVLEYCQGFICTGKVVRKTFHGQSFT